MSDLGDFLDVANQDDVHSAWLAVLRRWPDDAPTNFTIKQGGKLDALGLLCATAQAMGLDFLRPEEWDRPSLPYRTAQLAGLRCSKDDNGMAKGGQIDGIIALIDGGAKNAFIADILARGQTMQDIKKLFER